MTISDIGKTFDEEKLTIEDYKKTEDSYINAIHLIIDYLSLPYLKVDDVIRSFSLEMFQDLIKDYRELYSEEMMEHYSNVKNKDNLSKKKVDVFCRLLIRENIGAKVYYPRRMKVFIGYDYLMGVHMSKPLDPIIPLIEETGLFIEKIS
ncbi:hypothetical protein FQ087_21485 [Sporosarcina sp. ANT_H38]|uniref:hypothetical protein n=1 Tax=Sporosarcina sp. ANT_H38 TaxID=2597358 RepID=UPI0011F0BC21|nr:hypothetical protein [Sporosarcina sp. ANT_H38]KAA0941022.1 hypothetical protein FQ087_21485 [Sporosarcina sp. ANT_H38]